MSSNINYLIDDEKIHNQNFACISIITPYKVKGCKKYLIKCRGIYGNETRTEDECRKLNQKDPSFDVYKVSVGQWIAWKDKHDVNEDTINELNELMRLYKNERDGSKLIHEKRKEQLKKGEINNTEVFKNEDEIKIDDEIVEKKNYNKISYLKEDEQIGGQLFYCISFLTPEQLENSENKEKFKVRGFKIRGMFSNEENAKQHCIKLHKLDPYHNIYIAQTGHWVSWSDNIENAEDFEYSNKDLNNLMKSHKENQEKASLFNSELKNNMMNESLNSLKKNENVSNLVNEIIEDSFDEEFNLEGLECNDDNLDELNKELSEARKMYEKLLKEEKKKK
tara:strand:+ start:67 stop:1074 length:1008 start_codon:yes stop_codon:yes gene_type:complete